jgi:hypothetical protein
MCCAELPSISASRDPGRVYDPWPGKWTAAKLTEGRIVLPDFSRSVVVRLDIRG